MVINTAKCKRLFQARALRWLAEKAKYCGLRKNIQIVIMLFIPLKPPKIKR